MWEGILECLKWYNFDEIYIFKFFDENNNFYLLGGLISINDKKYKKK